MNRIDPTPIIEFLHSTNSRLDSSMSPNNYMERDGVHLFLSNIIERVGEIVVNQNKANVIEELSNLSESIRRRVEDADDAYGSVVINLKYWQAIEDAIAILKMEAIPVEWLEQYDGARFGMPLEECDDEQNNASPIALAIKAWRNR